MGVEQHYWPCRAYFAVRSSEIRAPPAQTADAAGLDEHGEKSKLMVKCTCCDAIALWKEQNGVKMLAPRCWAVGDNARWKEDNAAGRYAVVLGGIKRRGYKKAGGKASWKGVGLSRFELLTSCV